jgi:mitochondrial fission protein ELM1
VTGNGSDPPPLVWCLLSHRTGDNNQVLALAEALGWPFEEKRLAYNSLRLVPNALALTGFSSLTAEARRRLGPPLPELVIGVGQRSVPVARAIARRSKGRTVTVQIGWPRCDRAFLDLVITTANYPVPDRPNVLRLPIAMTRKRSAARSSAPTGLPERVWALLVGGPSGPWRLRTDELADAAALLAAKAEREGAALVALTSRRTPPTAVTALRDTLAGAPARTFLFTPAGPDGNPYDAVLSTARRFFVTGDSVAMLSDAIATGKPVGLVPPRADALGRARLAASRAWIGSGGTGWERDIEAFWSEAEAGGLLGSLEQPTNVGAPDVGSLAAERVRALLAERRTALPPSRGAGQP